MNSVSILRRYGSQGVGLAAVGFFLLGIYGCGSSSGDGNMGNGNTTTTTGGTVGVQGSNDGPPTVPPGTLLANAALPVGSWGGQILVDTGGFPTTLTVSSSGILVTLPCGELVSYAKPIVLDAAGSFNVQGTRFSGSTGAGATP